MGASPQATDGEMAGFFYCDHCDHVAALPADSDPAGTFKCPRCKKHAVRWRFASPARERRPLMAATPSPVVPAFSETAQSMFSKLREVVQ